MKIAVDFDGTIVHNEYPAIGPEKPFAVETLKALTADGHKLILWTSRSGPDLDAAVGWCRQRGLIFFAVNSNTPWSSRFHKNTSPASPKVVADIYVDDRNLGGLPDWGTIYQIISNREMPMLSTRSRDRHIRKMWLWHKIKRAIKGLFAKYSGPNV